MAAITAAAVQALRGRTGLPMMDCKKALAEAGGELEKAVELLRKAGAKMMEKRAGRATTAGRIAVYVTPDANAGAMVELRREVAPVSGNEHFVQLANDLAKRLADGPGADSPEALLAQPSPSKAGSTLKQQFDELNNRIREVFKLERIVRINGHCTGYAHHNGAAGVLLQFEGENAELARHLHARSRHAPGRAREGRTGPDSGGQGAGNPLGCRPTGRQAGKHHRQNGRRPAAKLLCRVLPHRTAVRQRRQEDCRPSSQGSGPEAAAFRPLGIAEGVEQKGSGVRGQGSELE